MSNEVVFYTSPISRGRIVHWMLEEVGAPYRIQVLDFEKREHKTPEYLAINPMGKVPAIVHRGTTVTEASAICCYLADAFPQAGLAPAFDDPKRGTYYRWFFFAASALEHAIVDRMFARPQVERPSTLGYGSYEDAVNTLEKAITPGPYILGDRFSAADVYICSAIGWGMRTKTLEPRPAFTRYVEHLTQRPTYKRFEAKANELMSIKK